MARNDILPFSALLATVLASSRGWFCSRLYSSGGSSWSYLLPSVCSSGRKSVASRSSPIRARSTIPEAPCKPLLLFGRGWGVSLTPSGIKISNRSRIGLKHHQVLSGSSFQHLLREATKQNKIIPPPSKKRKTHTHSKKTTVILKT